MCGVGVASFVLGATCGSHPKYFNETGAILITSGVIWTSSFLLIATKYKKRVDNRLQTTNLYQQEYKFSNGASLSTGIDILSDRTLGSNTIGLGLRYNF